MKTYTGTRKIHLPDQSGFLAKTDMDRGVCGVYVDEKPLPSICIDRLSQTNGRYFEWGADLSSVRYSRYKYLAYNLAKSIVVDFFGKYDPALEGVVDNFYKEFICNLELMDWSITEDQLREILTDIYYEIHPEELENA